MSPVPGADAAWSRAPSSRGERDSAAETMPRRSLTDLARTRAAPASRRFRLHNLRLVEIYAEWPVMDIYA